MNDWGLRNTGKGTFRSLRGEERICHLKIPHLYYIIVVSPIVVVVVVVGSYLTEESEVGVCQVALEVISFALLTRGEERRREEFQLPLLSAARKFKTAPTRTRIAANTCLHFITLDMHATRLRSLQFYKSKRLVCPIHIHCQRQRVCLNWRVIRSTSESRCACATAKFSQNFFRIKIIRVGLKINELSNIHHSSCAW